MQFISLEIIKQIYFLFQLTYIKCNMNKTFTVILNKTIPYCLPYTENPQ